MKNKEYKINKFKEVKEKYKGENIIFSIENFTNNFIKKIRENLKLKGFKNEIINKTIFLKLIESFENKNKEEIKKEFKEINSLILLINNSEKLNLKEIYNLIIKDMNEEIFPKRNYILEEDLIIKEGVIESRSQEALTLLQNMKIDARMEKGKINVKSTKIVFKKGEKLNQNIEEFSKILEIKLINHKPKFFGVIKNNKIIKKDFFDLFNICLKEEIIKLKMNKKNILERLDIPSKEKIIYLLYKIKRIKKIFLNIIN